MVTDVRVSLGSETIKIVSQRRDAGSTWQPCVGTETLALLEASGLRGEDKDRLRDEAVGVLTQCVPPTAPSGRDTGLVIGYVQSGKTMSFTTVAALAHDNHYRLIIVISGITTNLFQQSRDRLERDLRLRERTDRIWKHFANPKPTEETRQRITAALSSSDSVPGITRQTVLITVMKNSTHLNNLVKVLRGLSLSGIPTLVIDDEADQAGLNTRVKQGQESTIHRRLVDLRDCLPHHTFLQYTATPQALLLINLIDTLSPRFAALLTPGPAYTGGKAFFEGDFSLVRRIPPHEIPTRDQSLLEPPDSLLEAMRVFFLGVAAGLRSGRAGKRENRSMMVHPSRETSEHANYALWVRQIKQQWETILGFASDDPDNAELKGDFARAYADLRVTESDLPSFEDLVPYLPGAVSSTIVTEANASRGRTPQPDWHQEYAHIVVGGEVLNRGYTIEGLTVTYMPRGIGLGNADTIQQRARWFGYKADYLGYCRVYLDDQGLRAYQAYIRHEENIRSELAEYCASGRSLRDWRRAFFLSEDLRPTRSNVIDKEYVRGTFSNDWFEPASPHEPGEVIPTNRQTVKRFLAQLRLQPDQGHEKRTSMQHHLVAHEVRLSAAYNDLLLRLLVTETADWKKFMGMLLQVGAYLNEHPNETCTVYQMSRGQLRKRSLNDKGRIPTLFQGPNPDKTGEFYPGDSKIRAPDGVTIQLHCLRVHLPTDAVVAEDVPAVAVWVPSTMAAHWVVQDQGHEASEE